MRFFLAFTNALQNVRCEVVVFQVVEAVFNHLAQVEGFRAASLLGQKIETLFGFCGETNGGRNVSEYLYSIYHIIGLKVKGMGS